MKKTTAVLKYILSIHVSVLIILLILRITFFISNVGSNPVSIGKLFTAIIKGFRFDNVVVCLVMALPIFILVAFSLFNKIPKILVKFLSLYIILAFSLIFFNYVANIPYFKYSFNYIPGSALTWLSSSSGDVKNMILEDSSYYIYIFLYIILIICFSTIIVKLTRKLINTETCDLNKRDYKFHISAIFVVFALYFVGIRGSFEHYPIRIGMAYFCNNSFYNKLGINPTFFLVKSVEKTEKKYNLNNQFSLNNSVNYVKNYLNINHNNDPDLGSSLTRFVKTKGKPVNANVVIVLMESLSSEFLNWQYKGKSLTPYLHSLIEKSYYFENLYSAGTHTNNGILATLYGFLPPFDKFAMSSGYYFGLPMNLRNHGYQNLFFITGNPHFDNMYSFLSDNGFDKIYSQDDYPKNEIVNTWGVSDEYLFKYGIKELNKAHKENKPFFATFLTVSNHPPVVIPERFKDAGGNELECVISFVDNSIKDFMQEAEKQDWYKNTIFVFLGDHGKIIGKQTYDMPLNYNHIPLIIYSDIFNESKKIKDFGSQVDVYPTIMGLLNKPYINSSLGIDLFKTKRPYTFFVSDQYLGCIGEFFYMYEASTGKDALYDYRNYNTNDLQYEYKDIFDSMKVYSTSMFLTSKYIKEDKLARPSDKVVNNFFKKNK